MQHCRRVQACSHISVLVDWCSQRPSPRTCTHMVPHPCKPHACPAVTFALWPRSKAMHVSLLCSVSEPVDNHLSVNTMRCIRENLCCLPDLTKVHTHTSIPHLFTVPALTSISVCCSMQIALKTNQVGVLYFTDAISLVGLLEEGGAIDGTTFLTNWKVGGRGGGGAQK